jgi:hypothetical protein
MKNTRIFALPIIAAGIIGGAALGLAGTAAAATTADVQQPNIVAVPSVKAHPAPQAQPGWYWHHGVHHLAGLQPGYMR